MHVEARAQILIFSSVSSSTLFLGGQGISSNLDGTLLARLVDQLVPLDLPPQSKGYRNMPLHLAFFFFFDVRSEDLNSSVRFVQQVLNSLSHLPSVSVLSYKTLGHHN